MPLGLLPTVKGSEALGCRRGPTPSPGKSAPPSGFRVAKEVRAAWPSQVGPFARTSAGGTPAQRAGKRYEKKVLKFLG